MGKIYKRFLLTILALLFPIFAYAEGVEPDYEVEKVYVNAAIDIIGSMHIQEAFVVKGSLNGYRRVLEYKNDSLPSWEEGKVDLYGSSFYNGRGMSVPKVSAFKIEKDEIDWDLLNRNSDKFTEVKSATPGDKGVYTQKKIDTGYDIRVYNASESGYTVFYFDYYVNQAVVLHNDIAELYYTFFKLDSDDVKNVEIQVSIPWGETEDTFRFWAHGTLSGEIRGISESKNDKGEYLYRGALTTVNGYRQGEQIEVRMTFNRQGFASVEKILNESKMDAFGSIIEVETERANEANSRRAFNKKLYYGMIGFSSAYLIILVLLWVYVYIKYDKEYDSTFDHKYYREFTGDYNVEVVDYLMTKNISTNAFSASLMNLIYKKNIAIEEIPTDKKNKKDIVLTRKSTEGINEAEKILLELLFDTIGKDDKVTLKEVEKFSSKASTAEKFMKKYDEWKIEVQNDAINEGFFEEHIHILGISGLYLALGMVLIGFGIAMGIQTILCYIAVFVGSVAFLIYTLSFKKWTKKGREHYLKWNAFKNFLNDFGSFKDKNVQEIALWDKYLVYATVFGIAKKVQDAMKVQITEFGMNETDMPMMLFSYRDYYMMNAIQNSISKTYTNSQNIINAESFSSSMSSGGGFGGGISGGSGGAGGGGGGGGF